ncbi:MAG TPA: TRAP transporter small permease subunit [Myxococcota bacterium]|nr:TRAP transporter small permease subunit [Myxococcota bacterium]
MSLLVMVVAYVLMVLRDNARLEFECSRSDGQFACWGEDPFDRLVLSFAGYDVPNTARPHTQSEDYVASVETIAQVVSPIALGVVLFVLALFAVRTRERSGLPEGAVPPPVNWPRRLLWSALVAAGLWGGVWLISVIPSQVPTVLFIFALLGGGLWAFRAQATGRGPEIEGASPELFGDLRPKAVAAGLVGLALGVAGSLAVGEGGLGGAVALIASLLGLAAVLASRGAANSKVTMAGGALTGFAIGVAVTGFAVSPILGFSAFSLSVFVFIGLCGATLSGVIGGLLGAGAFGWYFLEKAGPDYAWTSGLTGILLLVVGFLGASMATHEGKHIQIDAIRKNLKSHRFHLYNLLGEVVSLLFTAFLGLMAVRYIFHTMDSGERHPGSDLNVWVAVVPIGLSLLFICFRFSIRIVDSFTAWRRREPAPELAPELH